MFNKVKTKLTVIFSLSLLCLLLLFIGVLYTLISHEINVKEVDELNQYFDKEKHEFIEHLYEKKHQRLEYNPNQSIFYYVYNQQDEFVYGKETVQSFSNWIKVNIDSKGGAFTERIDWKQNHYLILKKPLDQYGFVILGMDITGDKHLIENITWTLFAMTLLFSLFYAILGYYFAGQAMRPIKTAFQKQEKFVSDASHELRTPLSIFYSSVDLLMREEKDHLTPIGQEILLDVKTEAHLMNKLVNDLLVLARSDKNRLYSEKKEVDLSVLLMSICKRFSRKMLVGINLEEKIQSGINLVCDEIRIQQLIYILLDNALNYTKAGKVTVTLSENVGEKIITIEDTGCGIAKEDLPFIFDRFYRADVSREKGGAGIGLSIAKSIVTEHGGKIFASSTIGKGSVFTVIFK